MIAQPVKLSRKDLVSGQVFGFLEVLEKSGATKRESLYRCRCRCGKEIVVKRGNLTARNTTSCGCKRGGPESALFRGCGELPGKYWSSVKLRAKNGGLAFTISIEEAWALFLQQDRRCALSGLPLSFAKGEKTASLDRIDSTKGYEPGNVQWVHKDVNRMKQEFSTTYFKELCWLVIEKHKTILRDTTRT